MPRAAITLLAGLLAALLFAPAAPAAAAEEGGRRHVSRVTRDYAYNGLNAANDLLADEKYPEALAKLRELEASGRLNEYESALVSQTFGFVYYSLGDYEKSARAFEAIGTGILQPHAELNVLYNLGQLYVGLGRTAKAVKTLERWFRLAENPSPRAHIALANAYVQAERYADALPLVEKACAASDAPEESWLQLLLSLHTQAGRWEQAATVLEDLLQRFPRKSYWLQLSAVYAQLGRERDSMTALELADHTEPLGESSEVTRLAHLLLHNEIPYKGAVVLERGLSDGRLDATRQSYELLATSLLQARELDRALAPLEKAASLGSDGELWLRLAQLRVSREEWKEAERALAKAEELGGLDRPGTAALLAGITRLHQDEFVSAAQAFERARSFPETRRAADEFLDYLEEVRARRESDAAAEAETVPASQAPGP